MKRLLVIVLFILFLLIGWQLWSVFLSNSQEPVYKVLQKNNEYEIRKYDPYIIAQVSFQGSYQMVTNKGFKVLANYIFGDNEKNVKMPMTAPVFVEKNEKDNGYTVTFVMPNSYNKKTLPKPNDSRIKITAKPSNKLAVYSFSWYPSAKRVEQKKQKFMMLLKRDGIKAESSVLLARYNPPFILPFLMRNELLVTIK